MFFIASLLIPSLLVQTIDGRVYRMVDNIPDGTCVLTGTEELVFEASKFNTCTSILLQPGCYRAELRGGMGMANSECLDHSIQDDIQVVSALFAISEPTTVYALRGGDGNPGAVNVRNKYSGTFGGGASGVDSILVVGTDVWRASGGMGKTCVVTARTGMNAGESGLAHGNGIGGADVLSDSACSHRLHSIHSSGHINYIVGGGGGGAPFVSGGSDFNAFHSYLHSDVQVDPGASGTGDAAGGGGDIYVCSDFDCSEFISVSGGRGGDNVMYSCGGQYAVSYGGGGGGACAEIRAATNAVFDGGDGGTGSTGTSETSFIRIYKM